MENGFALMVLKRLLPDESYSSMKTTFLALCGQGYSLHGICDVPSSQTLFDGNCYTFTQSQINQFPNMYVALLLSCVCLFLFFFFFFVFFFFFFFFFFVFFFFLVWNKKMIISNGLNDFLMIICCFISLAYDFCFDRLFVV